MKVQLLTGFLSVSIPSSNALQATMFFIDGTRSNLDNFDLDLNFNALALSFSQLVVTSSFITPFFTIQNAQTMPSLSYQLQKSVPSTTTGENSTLIVPPSNYDIIGIKVLNWFGHHNEYYISGSQIKWCH